MRIFRGLLFSSVLLISSATFAQQKFSVYAGGGYQTGDARWSIAGNSNGTNPNIYSELIWKKLQSPSVQIGASWQFYKGFGICADFSQTFTRSGKVTDTDYGADNRQQLIYEGVFKDDEGHSTQYSAALTYTFTHKKYTLTPMLGYLHNEQQLYILPADKATPSDLRSSYKARWQGLLAGVEAELQVCKHFSITPALQYYQLQYDADANWNLITQFQHPVSFKHAANGYAIAPALKVNYNVNAHTKIFVKGFYTHWDTGHGRDQLFLANGTTDNTQMNGATRNETGINAGVAFSW